MLPQIQKPAPAFSAEAVMPDKSFKTVSLDDYKGKYVIFFYYPLDFTFVCPTEIIAFGDRQNEFSAINTQVIAASCDSQFTVSRYEYDMNTRALCKVLNIFILLFVTYSILLGSILLVIKVVLGL